MMRKALSRLKVRGSAITNGRRGMSAFAEDIEAAHLAACRKNQDTYIDPQTGYNVFTRETLKTRGKCCGNGCRHCPYGHFNVAAEWRQSLSRERINQPTYLRSRPSRLGRASSTIKVLFWSAGKNSFLSLQKLLKEQREEGAGDQNNVVLFTIFNQADENLPYQGIHIQQVMDQAKALKIDLLLVPQKDPSNDAYTSAVFDGLKELESIVKGNRRKASAEISSSQLELSLAFGDVKNEVCRSWRQSMFSETPYETIFPIWNMQTEDMLEELSSQKESWRVEVARCTSADQGSDSVAIEYNEEFIGTLPEGSSPIGEMGEFDTIVKYIPSS